MRDAAVIKARLRLLDQYVDELRGARGVSFGEYVADTRLRRFVERTLQLALEACLDIGNMVISREGLRTPTDNQDVFRVLAHEGIVPPTLLATLLKMARFRNLLVHDYARIDDAIVFGVMKKRLGDLTRFARAVVRYLEAGHPRPRPRRARRARADGSGVGGGNLRS